MRKELIFNLSFGLVNVLVMIIVIIFARGYTYNPNTNQLEKQGTLTVESEPSGASVYLGKDLIGTTPLQKTSITPGNYTLTIRQNDYFDLDTNVEIIDKYVTKRYYKLIKNKQQLLPISSSNIVSSTLSEDGSYFIYVEKPNGVLSLNYINFDKSAINVALGQDNAYTKGLIESKLNTISTNFEIITTSDGKQGILRGLDGTTLQYFKTEENYIPIDLLKTLKFIPNSIFFNRQNNLVIKKNNDYYYYDTNLNTLSLKASFKDNQNLVVNKGIYLVENNVLKVATNTNVINEYKEYILPYQITSEDITLEKVFIDEDLDGNLFISSQSKGNLGITKNGDIIPVTSTKKFSKANYRLKNNIYISNDNTEVLDINYLIQSTNITSQLLGENLLFGKSRDFIIIPDLKTNILQVYDNNFKLINTIVLELETTEKLTGVYLTKSDEVIILSKNEETSITSISKLIF